MDYRNFKQDFRKDSTLVLEVYGFGQISVKFMKDKDAFMSESHIISNTHRKTVIPFSSNIFK